MNTYPETAFLALFRMHGASFWQLVKMLTEAGGSRGVLGNSRSFNRPHADPSRLSPDPIMIPAIPAIPAFTFTPTFILSSYDHILTSS